MMLNRDTTPNPERRGTRLAAKSMGALALAIVVVLLTGVAGWWALAMVRHDVAAMQLVADGDAAAVADGLLARIDAIGMGLVAAVCVGVVLLTGVCVFLFHIVVKPLQASARLIGRLSVGDCREEAPAKLLARADEIGDLAHAIRNLTTYQRAAAGFADRVSTGDFTGTVAVRDPDDVPGTAIRRMGDVIIDTLRRFSAFAGEVMAGCNVIASAGGELSSNSAGIASSVPEISDGIDRIKTRADGNVGVVEQAGQLVSTGSKSIERGYEDIGEMGVVMLNMQACGDKIVGIAKSIGDIALQTNLLALNASVEAARAGRNGKGFTIVAEEVRSLAGRSSQAAEETSTLMKETVEQVELAAAIAGRINAIFADMQGNIQDAEALLAKIAAASREQSGDIEQIAAVLRQVNRAAQENMKHIGDIMETAGGMARQTGWLRDAMGRFRLDFRGSQASEPFSRFDPASSDVRLPRSIGRADRTP